MKKKLLEKMAKAINKVVGDVGNLAKVLGPPNGFDSWTLCWDGPFEWTMITAGTSVYAGELGNYSLPLEAPIQVVLDEINAAGYYLEPINGAQVAICKV